MLPLFRHPWSLRIRFAILASFCVGMIYISRGGLGSDIDALSITPPPTNSDIREVMSQQERRRNLIRHHCLKIGRKRRMPSGDRSTQHLIVDDDLRIVYCYVPKAASTNWKRVLLSLRDPRHTPLSILPDAGHKREWTVISSLEDTRLTDRNYFKFLVVRNPFERLLSTYRNKFEFAYSNYFRGRYGKRMKYYHDKRPGSSTSNDTSNDGIPSFADFLAYVSSGDSEKNEHWQSVNDVCHPCDIAFDFIGKYETLQQDSNFILNYIKVSKNIHRNWSFPLRKETYTRTRPTKELMEKYYESVPQDVRDKLSETFQSDMSLFGYSGLSLDVSTDFNSSNSNR